MVDVEEFGDAGERGVTVVDVVGGLAPGVEGQFLGGSPGDDPAGFIFALEDYGGVKSFGGGVGGEGGGPNELSRG